MKIIIKPTWALLLFVFAASGALESQMPTGGEVLCDPGLTGSLRSPVAYRQRGDRCEGIYALQVSSTQIRLVSMVETFAYDPGAPEALQVTWSRPAGNDRPIRLRAQSLQPRTYYRMDTVIGASKPTYEWPSDVLSSLKLPSDAIGVLGWTYLEGEDHKIYLPLRISQGRAPDRDSEYLVAIVPDSRLREIYVTLAPVKRQVESRTPIFEKKPLGYGLYMAKQATVFPLAKPEIAGLYEVGIECSIWGSGSATMSFYFYHAEGSGS